VKNLFAYGCLIDPEQLARHCDGAHMVGTARLNGYSLAFVPTSDDDWGGAVATLAQGQTNQWVEGVVYRITAHQLRVLDQYEEVDQGLYLRRKIWVQLGNGTMQMAWTFVATGNPGSEAPSTRYLQTLLRGAHRQGLSRAYIAKLESFAETCQPLSSST